MLGMEDRNDPYSDFESEERSRSPKLFAGIALIIFSLLGTTLAANITLNGGLRKEFGQGVYQIKTCDQWVQIYLTPSESTANGIMVQNVQVQGLDTTKCVNSLIRIKLYAASGSALNMYTGATSVAGTSAPSDSLVLKVVNSSTRATAVTLVDPAGRSIGRYDDWLYLSYDNRDGYGLYTIDFTEPLAKTDDVKKITIESAPSVA
jgi:hypothetical protein